MFNHTFTNTPHTLALVSVLSSDHHPSPSSSSLSLTHPSLDGENNNTDKQQPKQKHESTSPSAPEAKSMTTSSSEKSRSHNRTSLMPSHCIRLTFKFGTLSDRSCFTTSRTHHRHKRRLFSTQNCPPRSRLATLVRAHMVKSKPLKISCARNARIHSGLTSSVKEPPTTIIAERFKIKCFTSVIDGFHRHCILLVKQQRPDYLLTASRQNVLHNR